MMPIVNTVLAGEVAKLPGELRRIREMNINPVGLLLQFERRATRWVDIDAQVLADQQRTADFYLSAGLIPQKLDVRGTFDTRFNGAKG